MSIRYAACVLQRRPPCPISLATDAPTEEGTEAPGGEVTDGRRRGQRRGQRRRHTVVYTVLVVAVMDDNHISVVSHRRENVRFVAEMGIERDWKGR
jgi:hypothetical protein